MNSLIRFEPMNDRLDDLFAGFFRPLAAERSALAQIAEIRIDVHEDDKSYFVDAVVPGAKKDDLQVAIDGNEVTISAEVKNEKEAKDGARVLRCERYYGKSARRFALAQEVDETNAQAKYEEGVLKLTLPKKAAAAVRKLAIQ